MYGYLRPYLNKVWLAEFEGLCSVDQYVFSVDSRLADSEYISWFMRSPTYLARAPISTTPGQLPRIRTDEVAAVEVELPPLDVQRRVASAIRAQLAAVNKAGTAAEAQRVAAKQMAVACLRSVFESAAASSWPREPLHHHAALLPSKSLASGGDTPVAAITTACLTEEGFSPAGIKRALMHSDDAALSIVTPGEVLVARSNTPELVGRASVYEGIPEQVVASDLTIRIRTDEDLLPAFLGAYLSYLFATGYWKERAGGASGSMKKITRAQILAEEVPVPGRPAQDIAVAKWRGNVQVLAALRKGVTAQVAHIHRLPAALLSRFFTSGA